MIDVADGLIVSALREQDGVEDNDPRTQDTSWLANQQPHEVYRDRGPHPDQDGSEPPHPQVGMLTLHTGGDDGNADINDFDDLGFNAGGAYDVDDYANPIGGAFGEAVRKILDEKEADAISKHFGTFGVATSAKSEKGQNKGYLNGVMYLAPERTGGTGVNYCPHASPGCKAVCLFNSGRIGMSKGRAQIAKTQEYHRDRRGFEDKLHNDITRAKTFAAKKGYKLAVRLNGTSDIPFHKHGIMEKHPDVQFYDYTKDHERVHQWLAGKMPKNYHLTYSLDEKPESWAHANNLMNRGAHVAVPFDISRKEALPATWHGRKVLNGDESDLRFLDPKPKPGGGMWVGLHSKQRTSGGPPPEDFGFLVKNPHLNP